MGVTRKAFAEFPIPILHSLTYLNLCPSRLWAIVDLIERASLVGSRSNWRLVDFHCLLDGVFFQFPCTSFDALDNF